MTSISSRHLVAAVLRFEQRTFQDRERLIEEVPVNSAAHPAPTRRKAP